MAAAFFLRSEGRKWHITAFAVPQHLGRYWGRADIGKVTANDAREIFTF
jgi:hypothetical protein